MKTFDFTDTGGLFDHFEVNREAFWPRIGWLIAGSGAWHLVLVACIVFIPPVRDAFAIAVIFSGGSLVDRPYAHTDIGDNAEIIELTTEKFHYPEGYFLMDQQGFPPPPQFPVMPPFVPASGSPVASPTPTPAPSPSAVTSPAIAANTANKDDKTKPAATPEDKAAEDKLQAEREQTAKSAGIEMPEEGEVNKKPFKELGWEAKGMSDKGQLDMNQQFEVTIETELDEKGKLVNARITNKSGDAQLVYLSRRFVEALNDSGILYYLKALSENNPKSKVVFTIKQDMNLVTAVIEADATTPDTARVLTKGFNAAIAYGVSNRRGKVEEQLLKNTTTSQDGKKIVFNFSMPRQEVVTLVQKELASASPSP